MSLAGTYAEQGAQYCQICDAGKYSGEGAGGCTECPAMTYAPGEGVGATACTNVEQGMYCIYHLMNSISTHCITVSIIKGYYTTIPSQSVPQTCAEGYYGVELGSIETLSIDCTTDYSPDTTSGTMCPETHPICFAPGDGNYCSNVCSFCPAGTCELPSL